MTTGTGDDPVDPSCDGGDVGGRNKEQGVPNGLRVRNVPPFLPPPEQLHEGPARRSVSTTTWLSVVWFISFRSW